MNLRHQVDTIYRERDRSTDFELSTERLIPILKTLGGPIPAELQEYLDTCIPTHSTDTGPVQFHGIDDLICENSEAVPGMDTIHQRMVCLAKDGGGDQFAFCIDERKVYHIDVEAGVDAAATKRKSYASWATIDAFLEWTIEQLRTDD